MKLLLMLFCISFLFACGKKVTPEPPPSLLVGNWNEVSESDTIFSADGNILYDSTFAFADTDSWNFTAAGTDSLVSSIQISPNYNTMVFTIVRHPSSSTGRYVLKGNTVTHTNAATGSSIIMTIQQLTATQLVLYSKVNTTTSTGTYTYVFRTFWERK